MLAPLGVSSNNKNMGVGVPRKTVEINDGTESEAFEIQGELGFVIVGVTTGSPTLTLQVSDSDVDFIDTTITVAGSASDKQYLDSDAVSIVAGLCGHGKRFKWSADGSTTVEIHHFSRLM